MESVVALTVDDAGEVLTLQRAAYVSEAQAHGDLQLPPLTQSLDELVDELAQPSVTTTGLRDADGRLVAAVRVRVRSEDPRAADLGRLVVAPDVQGRGLGSRLLRLAEDRLASHVSSLRLFTGERSVGNLRLYGRFGYRETHRTPTPGGYALVHLAKEIARTSKPVS
ncbi:GNAT family N-acetyltransferase [Rhodococcus hoagii]|uniref:GNAT family N-acetyltransferase n=1 Tax=Rhodococcus hoagii TaxID=43767 RepID=UPI0009BDB48B|nr:GNAT family N-acetyltransferase [Prescottella equi]MBM4523808.1 GNAT family N-acetyltransferase [Prescottella equi]MBM4649615.1 GNAT family N-acetyltransferase [Prescottella equi]MBM4682825.1 GNAT family N-acetyltransferase [Prescottella equi]NKS79746.1 GNAT family N-acetyltransferase [Prescottella equi]OQQ25887.1 GCN5 family acetyltransferase [Prescottella equi]